MRKIIVWLAKKLELGSALACRLTYLTNKAATPTHPKHLVDFGQLFYLQYLKKTDQILDLGCHNGEHTFKAANQARQVIGLDINSQLLNQAKTKAKLKHLKNIRFYQHDLEKKLPFKTNQFDKVFFLAVLEHLNNRNQILREIRRVLKKQGLLFISVPNKNTKWKKLQRSVGFSSFSDPDHKTEYSHQAIVSFLEKHGFKLLQVKTTALDTPLAGIIDLIGGISLFFYRQLMTWKIKAGQQHPEDSVAFHIVAQNV